MKCLWAAAAAPNCGTGRLVWVWVAPRAGPYPAEGAQGCPMWDRFYSRHKRSVSSCLDISWCHLEPIDAQFQPTWRSSQAALIHSDSEIIHTSALLQHCDIFFFSSSLATEHVHLTLYLWSAGPLDSLCFWYNVRIKRLYLFLTWQRFENMVTSLINFRIFYTE